jgi:protease I
LSFERLISAKIPADKLSPDALKETDIAQLAWAGQGIVDRQLGTRTVESIGSTYPLELSFVTDRGVFVYVPDNHSFERVNDRDVRDNLVRATKGNQAVKDCALAILVTGYVKQFSPRYGNRSRRYLDLEVGRTVQNLELQARALGLASVGIIEFDLNLIRRNCRLKPQGEPLYLMCIGYPEMAEQVIPTVQHEQNFQEVGIDEIPEDQMTIPQPVVEDQGGKNVVLIAAENFRDEELFDTRQVLEAQGINVTIASTKTGLIRGTFKGEAQADILIADINVDDYDAVVFIGGIGAQKLYRDKAALNVVRRAVYGKKVVAAICIAPTILANAGVLKDVKVTSFPSEKKTLIQAGAKYQNTPLQKDGNIITANGPPASKIFADMIFRSITQDK